MGISGQMTHEEHRLGQFTGPAWRECVLCLFLKQRNCGVPLPESGTEFSLQLNDDRDETQHGVAGSDLIAFSPSEGSGPQQCRRIQSMLSHSRLLCEKRTCLLCSEHMKHARLRTMSIFGILVLVLVTRKSPCLCRKRGFLPRYFPGNRPTEIMRKCDNRRQRQKLGAGFNPTPSVARYPYV